jgi:tetratricopeptide (TPR) repeat protein
MQASALMDHLDPDTLAAYVDGRLAVAELGLADRHIDGCQTCRHELSALAAVHTQPKARTAAPSPDSDRLGRYEVLRELGRGAMGLVLRAYDPELARPVAIKLLHDVDARTRDRLRLEAQAMARLRHPNVVTVYDVVAEADTMFVAMELVDGDTLRGHCRGRPMREVLDACIRAGRGLAAAHDARLVHRDFKPENVLCGADGEVRVSDFGLARVDDTPGDGAIAGTPAYMAPEVLRGEPATARSDQYSFCVSTYEMLHGERPAAGDEPEAGDVPAWVSRVLRRGLTRDPDARYPSMHALLAALAADPARRRRRRLRLATGAGLGIALGAGAVWLTHGGGPSCAIDDRALAGAWDADSAQRVQAAIGKASDEPTARRVVAALDDYAHAWLDARRDACEQLALDRRTGCLDRGRRELTELVHLLGDADARLADHAIEAIGRLRDPAACTGDSDEDAADADPVDRAVADVAAAGIDRANALEYAGKLDEAVAAANQVIAGLDLHDEPRSRAEALLVRGRAETDHDRYTDGESSLFDALSAAERGHDDALAARIWVEIVLSTGAQQHRFELAMSNARAADAALLRVSPPPELVERYDYALGTMLLAQGKLPASRERLEAGLALVPADPRHRGQAGMFHAALCNTLRGLGKLPAAHEHCAEGAQLLEQALGPDHVKLAIALNGVGAEALAEHDFAAAERDFARASAIFEHAHATDQVGYALALTDLGATSVDRGDLAHAQTYFERARDAFAAHHADHPQRIIPLQGLASIAFERGDLATTIRYDREAVDAITATYAADSPSLSIAEYNLALAYVQAKQPIDAQKLLDRIVMRSLATGNEQWMLAARALDLSALLASSRHDLPAALALRERALAAIDHAGSPPDRAYIVRQLAESQLALHRTDQAIASAEEAERYFEAHPDNPYDVASARWILAQALWAGGGDHARALALARGAADSFAKAAGGMNLAQIRGEVAAWLRVHEKS